MFEEKYLAQQTSQHYKYHVGVDSDIKADVELHKSFCKFGKDFPNNRSAESQFANCNSTCIQGENTQCANAISGGKDPFGDG
ncbi:MAG: hypothetical protein OER85_06070 [Gammaproteobacteria bacterium]|nr:hypothetical protein [Gammaproteobacteria bacterium]